MVEQITFSRSDYEKAIARIFDTNGHPVGTGFLVAPGYVLTCAHVVLQALKLGNDHKDFSSYNKGKPDGIVTLDFPVSASGQIIEAIVVEWRDYSIEAGDIAGLKLSSDTPIPENIHPIVVQSSDFDDDCRLGDACRVYGFADNVGGWSDDYSFKGRTAGNRIQFRQVNGDETIRGGFSGGPVWNVTQKCVIGMVATAQKEKGKAHAIQKSELNAVLQRLSAFSLVDLLEKDLACCSSQEKQQLERAIASALKTCHPNVDLGHMGLHSRIYELIDLPESKGWQEDRLTQFAVLLAKMIHSPTVYNTLKSWVGLRGCNFPVLLERVTAEIKQKKSPVGTTCTDVMVEVAPDEQNETQVRISMWAIADREIYDPLNPPSPDIQDETVVLSKLPKFLHDQLEQLGGRPRLHLFMPFALIDSPIDVAEVDDDRFILGSERPVLIRLNLNLMPTSSAYSERRLEKWQELTSEWDHNAKAVLMPAIDASQYYVQDKLSAPSLVRAIRSRNAAVLSNFSDIKGFFELVVKKTALPIALWSRKDELNPEVSSILGCSVRELPERIRQQREDVEGEDEDEDSLLLGRHLSLVWEDPKVVLPTMLSAFEAS